RLLKLFLKITHRLRSQSQYNQAIQVAHQILRFEPANEAAHQHLMFCFVATGDRAAALRQYEQCERALLDDLDVPPLAETSALYHWIKQQESPGSSTTAKITNLPIPLTSFVGRREPMNEVKRLLDPQGKRSRLLTLTGAGGSGKTRLAIQVATDLLDRFAQGVWWVELAALSEGEQVARAVAKTFGVSEVAQESCLQSVSNFLADKTLLLLLDNCEHLVESAADVVNHLLSRCPHLQILATSRESLNVVGEIVWQVPTLALPAADEAPLCEAILQHEGLQLFYERASVVQPGFQINSENAAAVVEICTQLDGIPLAIELAAARIKVLSVEQIASRIRSTLGARFDLLKQGSRSGQARQQTLRATLDWSYQLLDEEERRLFRSVAVFRNGFTMEALEELVDSSTNTILSPLDLLSQLVDKSLVMVEPLGGQHRYRLLETLREYALEQSASLNELTQLRQCHADYFLQLAEEAQSALSGAQQGIWLNILEREHANIRVALDFLIERKNGEAALRLASAMYEFWDIRGYASEGRQWLYKALTLQNTASRLTVGWAHHAAGVLALIQGEYAEANQGLQSGLEIFEEWDHQQGIVASLQDLACVDMLQGNYHLSQQRLGRSLILCQTSNDAKGLAYTFNFLGNLHWDLQQLTRARDYYLESLRLHQQLGNQARIAAILFNLGDTELYLGDLAAARRYFEECLKLSRALGNKRWIGVAVARVGKLALNTNDYAQAQRYAEEALALMHEIGAPNGVGMALTLAGEIAQKLRELPKALAYFCRYLQTMYKLGYKWSIFDALESLARFLTQVGHAPEQAIYLLGAADQLRQELHIPVTPKEQTDYYAEVLTTLCQQAGQTCFDQLWEKGHSAPLEQVIEEAMALSIG
ncbi:MAG: tetratricopeptide repeat protein, partial [Caldilineaceae bacterium]